MLFHNLSSGDNLLWVIKSIGISSVNFKILFSVSCISLAWFLCYSTSADASHQLIPSCSCRPNKFHQSRASERQLSQKSGRGNKGAGNSNKTAEIINGCDQIRLWFLQTMAFRKQHSVHHTAITTNSCTCSNKDFKQTKVSHITLNNSLIKQRPCPHHRGADAEQTLKTNFR